MILTFVTTACEKDSENVSNDTNRSYSFIKGNDGSIQLGERIEDPYKFENMEAAFQKLCEQGVSFPFSGIAPTNTYVKVLIHSEEELESIEADTTLIWFDYPLDYEIVNFGSYYFDPTLDSSYSWQYGVIPLGYTLPSGLTVNQIYQVFIPEENPDYDSYKTYYDMIEEMSESMCDKSNVDESLESKSGKWYPSAHITVYDNFMDSNVSLEGVRVNVHRGCKTRYAVTDADGECTFDTKFKGKVDYSIEWRRHYWRIVYGDKNKKAYYTGSSKEGKWEINMDVNCTNNDIDDYMRATIHRAAVVANYKPEYWPIAKPHKTNLIGCNVKLIIRYEHKKAAAVGSAEPGNTTNLGGADVVIRGMDENGDLRGAQFIFSNTLHELAHCAHAYWYDLRHNNGDFDFVNKFIIESWASCVQWKVTTDYYEEENFDNRGYNGGLQNWTSNLANSQIIYYTPVFIDLIDNYNQHNYIMNAPEDEITGYTLIEIQDNILEESTDKNSLENALKRHKLHSTTDDQISALLLKYRYLPF